MWGNKDKKSTSNAEYVTNEVKDAIKKKQWEQLMAFVDKVDDQKILAYIAKNTDALYWHVSFAAFEKITDPDMLADIAKNCKFSDERLLAVEKISYDSLLLTDIAKNGRYDNARIAAIENLFDENMLADIAKNSMHRDERFAAFEAIYDQKILADIAKNGLYSDTCKAAYEAITDPLILSGLWPAKYRSSTLPSGIFNNRALDYLNQGNPVKAEKCWKEALKINPVCAVSQYNYSVYLWKTARIDGKEAMRRLSLISTEDINYYYCQAKLYMALFNTDGAINSIEIAIYKYGETEELMKLLEEAKERKEKGWDGGSCIHTFEGYTEWFKAVCFSPDGKRALSGSGDHMVKVWDVDTCECVRTLKVHTSWQRCYVSSVCFSPDGKQALSGSGDSTVKVLDIKTGECIRNLEGHSKRINSVHFSPDGKRALSGSADCTVKVWDMESGQCIRTLEGHGFYVLTVCFDTDGKRALSGSEDNTVKVWDIERGECMRTLEGHTKEVRSVHFSPDGKQVLSGSGDQTVKVWDIDTGKCIRTIKGYGSTRLSPDGKTALSISDKTLKVWDINTGECFHTLEGHTSHVFSACISPDGKRALSASHDKTMKMWTMPVRPAYEPIRSQVPAVDTVIDIADDEIVDGVLIIPDGTKTIDSWEYSGRTDFSGVAFPEGLTEIAYEAFIDCASLEDIRFPKSLTTIKNGAFKGCKRLKKVIIAENVIKVENESFKNCERLEEFVVLGDTVAFELGWDSVFTGCDKLKKLIMSPEVWDRNRKLLHWRCSIGGLSEFEVFSLHLSVQTERFIAKKKAMASQSDVNSSTAIQATVDVRKGNGKYKGEVYVLSICLDNGRYGRKLSGFEIDAPLCQDGLYVDDFYIDETENEDVTLVMSGIGKYRIMDAVKKQRIIKREYSIAHRPKLMEPDEWDPFLLAIYCFRVRPIFADKGENESFGPWSDYYVSDIGTGVGYSLLPRCDFHEQMSHRIDFFKKAAVYFCKIGIPTGKLV